MIKNIMNIDPIKPLDANGVAKVDGKDAPKSSFLEMMKKSVDEVNAQQKEADQALASIADGSIKDLHEAAIAINKAESSMKLMLEVRNKAINAYKEISRTQI